MPKYAILDVIELQSFWEVNFTEIVDREKSDYNLLLACTLQLNGTAERANKSEKKTRFPSLISRIKISRSKYHA